MEGDRARARVDPKESVPRMKSVDRKFLYFSGDCLTHLIIEDFVFRTGRVDLENFDVYRAIGTVELPRQYEAMGSLAEASRRVFGRENGGLLWPRVVSRR